MAKNIEIILHTKEGISGQHTVITKSGKPLIIKAQNAVTYELKDSVTKVSPDQIVTKHVGKNLHINLSAEKTGLDDIIIEDYL